MDPFRISQKSLLAGVAVMAVVVVVAFFVLRAAARLLFRALAAFGRWIARHRTSREIPQRPDELAPTAPDAQLVPTSWPVQAS